MPLPRYSCKTQTRSILDVPSPRSWRRQVPTGNPSSTILMLGLDGFTLCPGIICHDLNGGNYRVGGLKSDTVMRMRTLNFGTVAPSEYDFMKSKIHYGNSACPLKCQRFK